MGTLWMPIVTSIPGKEFSSLEGAEFFAIASMPLPSPSW